MRLFRVNRLVLAALIGGAAVVGSASAAGAATAVPISSLSFSTAPGSVLALGPAYGTYSTPSSRFVFTPMIAVGSPTAYEAAISTGPKSDPTHQVEITVAPPSGTFVTGQTFAATGVGGSGEGRLQVEVDGRTCTSESSTVTIADAAYSTGGQLTRLGFGFVDHCNATDSPPVVANLYANESVLAPIPLTREDSGPLTAVPAGGAINGTVAAFHILPAPGPGAWVVLPTVNGITDTDTYVTVVTLDVATTKGPDMLENQDACSFTATGTGTGDSCVGTVNVPTGTLAYGNTFSIERTVPGTARVTVATGAFLATQP